MINLCPQCSSKITDFAVSCDNCDWSLVSEHHPSDFRIKIDSDDNLGKFESDEAIEETIQIVKKSRRKINNTNQQSPPSSQTPPHLAEIHSSSHDENDSQINEATQRALEFIELGDLAASLTYLDRAIIDLPVENNGECYSLRGYAHLKNLDFLNAETDCTHAIDLGWEEPQTYAWRAAARGEQNKWPAAFDDLKHADQIAANDDQQYQSLITAYSKNASDYYRTKIQEGKDSADLFFDRGWVYFKANQFDKAKRDFHLALKKQPGHPSASMGLAELKYIFLEEYDVRELCDAAIKGSQECQAYGLKIRAMLNFRENKIDAARNDIRTLMSLAGEDPNTNLTVCRLLRSIGEFQLAIKILTTLILNKPKGSNLFRERGECLAAIDCNALALKDFKKHLQQCRADFPVLLKSAELAIQENRLDLAQRRLKRALKLDLGRDDEVYLIRSRAFLCTGDLSNALQDCEASISSDNTNPEAFALLAAIQNAQSNPENAISALTKAIDFENEDIKKSALIQQRAQLFRSLQKPEPAIKELEHSVSLNPSNPSSWLQIAELYEAGNDWESVNSALLKSLTAQTPPPRNITQAVSQIAEKSCQFFDKKLQNEPQFSPELSLQRARSYQLQGLSEKAIADCNLILASDPNHISAKHCRGQVFNQQNNSAAAMDDLTSALKAEDLSPETQSQLRFDRAVSHNLIGNKEEAKSDLLKAIRLTPLVSRNYVFLGELHQQTGEFDKSLRAFEKSITIDPKNPNVHRKSGVCNSHLQNHHAAIGNFSRAIDLAPRHVEPVIQRGQAYLKIDQPQLALEDFEFALHQNDQLSKAYSGRAAALAMQGKIEKSLISLTKAIHRFTRPRDIAEIIFARGKIFYQMGRNSPAVSDFSFVLKSMRSDPNYATATRYARAIANVHDEKWDKAQRDFRKLSKLRPSDREIKNALAWLADRKANKPNFLNSPKPFLRPTRPSVTGPRCRLTDDTNQWNASAPHDWWVVRSVEKKEFGPVHFETLKNWIRDGRVTPEMRVLRADWSKWKRPEKIFPAILETAHPARSQKNLSSVELEANQKAPRNGKESPKL
ncbi:MAG: tetratricopeptide repeat protein [Planctomycetaceae bacterium]|nr:tetratricopeptide repeat protein [Planctomycetaceae bacterium]